MKTISNLLVAAGNFATASSIVAFAVTIPGELPAQSTTTQYKVVNLGRFESQKRDSFLWPKAISDHNVVVGQADLVSERSWQAAKWENGVLTALGPLPVPSGGIPDGWAAGVNAHGQIVGWSTDGTGIYRAIMFEKKGLVDLGSQEGYQAIANAINNGQQVVGTLSFYPLNPQDQGRTEAVLWQKGKVWGLGNPVPTLSSTAIAINDSGMVAGTADWGSGAHAAIFADGHWKDLGTKGSATSVNSLGWVVGYSTSTLDSFLYKDGALTYLHLAQIPTHINDHGQIVAQQSIYSNGVWRNINTLIVTKGWSIGALTDINNNGIIIGVGSVQGSSGETINTGVEIVPLN